MNQINKRILEWIGRWPTVSYLIINKILWTIGFFYSIWVIQGTVPNLRQWILGAAYAVVTIPFGYWINALFFQVKKNTSEKI